MDLKDLVSSQRAFDKRHGWTPAPNDPRAICSYMTKDLVGLLGEIGEFANLVKKLDLIADDEAVLAKAMSDSSDMLEDELIDTLIYVLRLASHLDVDLEAAYNRKRDINEQRFKKFLVDDDRE